MSRFIKNPVAVPADVSVVMEGDCVSVKGPRGEVRRRFSDSRLRIEQTDAGLTVSVKDEAARVLAGTYWRILEGMVGGAKDGVEKILDLVGVGYRAQMAGEQIELQLGFSHPVRYTLPEGVSAALPSQTEIVLTGADKAVVGQAAADIRAHRPPEPYKGKGVRYRGELVRMKEVKKK